MELSSLSSFLTRLSRLVEGRGRGVSVWEWSVGVVLEVEEGVLDRLALLAGVAPPLDLLRLT